MFCSPPKKKLKQATIMDSFMRINNTEMSASEVKDHCAVEIEPREKSPLNSPDMFAFSSTSSMQTTSEVVTTDVHIIQEETFVSDVRAEISPKFWSGKPVLEMKKITTDSPELVELKPSHCHTILFQLPYNPGEVPSSYPFEYQDYWDTSHVRMPCSQHNLYPVSENGESSLQQRWNLIKEAYRKPISNSFELEKAILAYNGRYNNQWNFQGLHTLIESVFTRRESKHFFEITLPGIIKLALALPDRVKQAPILLTRQKSQSLSLSQSQIASLLANAFLCTYPRRNTQKRQSEFSTYPDINFIRLFENKSKVQWINEKLKCIFHYFDRVSGKEPIGVVTFTRQVIKEEDLPSWENASETLLGLHVSSTGTIEKGTGLLQMDFANRYVGGGVLGWGCVQEEIRFITCPELIIARLFTEALDNNEALIITGSEQYCSHSGYRNTFRFEGDYADETPYDKFGRRQTTLVAIDALRFQRKEVQYRQSFIKRELNKAYVGFSCSRLNGALAAVATGNWGCGAYRGDPRLKCLIQLMAAARTGRDVVYFTFEDDSLREELYDMYSVVKSKNISVGTLYQMLCQYGEQFAKAESPTLELYPYLYALLDSYDCYGNIGFNSDSSNSFNDADTVHKIDT